MDAANRARLTDALAFLGAAVGDRFALDRDGTVTLRFDGDRALTIEAPTGSADIYIHGPVCRVTAAGRTALFGAALARNLFRIGPPDAWLALDEAGETLMLCCVLPSERLTGESLADALDSLFAMQAELARGFNHASFASALAPELFDDARLIRP